VAVLAFVAALLGTAVYLDPARLEHPFHNGYRLLSPCGFLYRTGYPCPTCYMTRSFAYLMHGRPDKAFAAQAILARTFTLQKIAEKPKLDNRDANASTNKSEFQAYDAAKVNDRIKKAVESTRGKVLAYNGDYVRAWFHAYSGGKTATAKDGLDFTQAPTPYIVSINDSQFDTAIPDNIKTWKASFSLDQVRNAVKKISGSDPGKVTSIILGPKNPSDRTDTIKADLIEKLRAMLN
jgi:SpoIID/LytB domain protein